MEIINDIEVKYDFASPDVLEKESSFDSEILCSHLSSQGTEDYIRKKDHLRKKGKPVFKQYSKQALDT